MQASSFLDPHLGVIRGGRLAKARSLGACVQRKEDSGCILGHRVSRVGGRTGQKKGWSPVCGVARDQRHTENRPLGDKSSSSDVVTMKTGRLWRRGDNAQRKAFHEPFLIKGAKKWETSRKQRWSLRRVFQEGVTVAETTQEGWERLVSREIAEPTKAVQCCVRRREGTQDRSGRAGPAGTQGWAL